MPPPTKIFVGSLPPGSKPEELRILFANYGVVVECDVMNRCGFVHMETADMARTAIAALNGTNFKGQEIVVEEGRPKDKSANAGNNGRNSTNAGSNRINTNNGGSINSRGNGSGRGSFNNNFARNPSNLSRPVRNDAYKQPRNQPYARPAANINQFNQPRNNNNFGGQRDVRFNRNANGNFNNSSPTGSYKNQESWSLPNNNQIKNNSSNGGFRNNDNNGYNSNQGNLNNSNNQFGGYGRSNPNNVQDRRGFALPNGNQIQQTQLSKPTNNQFNRNGNQFQGSQYNRDASFSGPGDMPTSRNANGNMFSSRTPPNNMQNNRNSRGGGFNQSRGNFNGGRNGASNNRFVNHNYKQNDASNAMNGNFNNDYQKDFPQLGKQRNFGRGRNRPTSYNANVLTSQHS